MASGARAPCEGIVEMDVLLLTGNLMGSSRVSGVVREFGLTIRMARGVDDLPELDQLRAVLVDLELPLDIAALNQRLAGSPARRVAFGPHVDEARLTAAREAGWDVMTRGQFDQALPDLAADWADAAE